MAMIPGNIQQVRERIQTACASAQRPAHQVDLLAVTKSHGPQEIREAFLAGQHQFGENYAQEALNKMASLEDLRSQIRWHFIGPLQTNKTRVVAENFDWVHSVDRLKIAQRLSDQRPAHLPPLQVCLQVNIDEEVDKQGVGAAEVSSLAQAVSVLPRLQLRGLMSIPAPADGFQAQRRAHRLLRELMNSLGMPSLGTLSMGMSNDLEAAIMEGSTLVRVGTAIFGSRARTSEPKSSDS
jgi:pyridoxal phosphate enzyme (YggS family)